MGWLYLVLFAEIETSVGLFDPSSLVLVESSPPFVVSCAGEGVFEGLFVLPSARWSLVGLDLDHVYNLKAIATTTLFVCCLTDPLLPRYLEE